RRLRAAHLARPVRRGEDDDRDDRGPWPRSAAARPDPARGRVPGRQGDRARHAALLVAARTRAPLRRAGRARLALGAARRARAQPHAGVLLMAADPLTYRWATAVK